MTMINAFAGAGRSALAPEDNTLLARRERVLGVQKLVELQIVRIGHAFAGAGLRVGRRIDGMFGHMVSTRVRPKGWKTARQNAEPGFNACACQAGRQLFEA